MQGTQNAERLMKQVKKVFVISDTQTYNKAYSICMGMKIVYANKHEENQVLFKKIKQAGIFSRLNK